MTIIIGTWLMESDIEAAEDVLRLDVRIEGGEEQYAVFVNEDETDGIGWHQLSDWLTYEQAMEELQSYIYLFADATPKCNASIYIDGLSEIWMHALSAYEVLENAQQ